MSSQPDPEYCGGFTGPETGGEDGVELRGVQDTKDRYSGTENVWNFLSAPS